jgi:AcrR family transcriptional regulator
MRHPRPATDLPRATTPRPGGAPAGGLRELKKARTREAIQRHALALFREQGYTQTTVEAIAEAAEVSPSTFYRYFPTKEDVVLYDALDPLVIEAYRRQPVELDPLDALRAAFQEVWQALSLVEIEGQVERGRLALTEPVLQGRYLVELVRTVSLTADLIAERLGRDASELEIRVTAGAATGAMLAALLPALTEDPVPDLGASVDAVIDFLRRGFRL